ncbi:MAG: uroporphyrinogen-III synthase, partial [Alphaproteobacteria bacterium]|nr:uroporphyrinogen-III synthase [Alphaproteobacteria bacterium]
MNILVLTQSSPPTPAFLKHIQKLGFNTLHAPVLSVTYHDSPLKLDFIPRTLVVTSKHALNNIASLALKKDVQVLCVGETLKSALMDKGFTNILSVFETGTNLIKNVQEHSDQYRDILFLRGRDVQYDLEPVCKSLDISFQEHIQYHTSFVDVFPEDVRLSIILEQHLTIGVFSSRGAQALANIIKTQNLGDKVIRTNLLCLSDRMLKSLDHFKWKKCYTCPSANQQSFI